MRVHRYQSVLAFILSSLVGCSTLPEYEYSGPFKIEFGTITDNGEYYYMEEVTRTIQWKPTPDGFPIVGASVENTQKEYFELAFVVYFDEQPVEKAQLSGCTPLERGIPSIVTLKHVVRSDE